MATPGKLDKSKWEQPAAAAASGGAAVASGAKGMASKFEQAAKDAAPPAVVKKKSWKTSGASGGIANEGKYKSKTVIGDGPPPPKSVADLP